MLVVRGLECSCAKSGSCARAGSMVSTGAVGMSVTAAGAGGQAGWQGGAAGDVGRTTPLTPLLRADTAVTTRSDTGALGSSSANKHQHSLSNYIIAIRRVKIKRFVHITPSDRSTLVKPVSTAHPRLQSVAAKHQASRNR